MLEVDAVNPDHHLVRAQVAQGLFDEMPDQGELTVAEQAACHDDIDIGAVRESVHDGQGIGDDRQVLPCSQVPCQLENRGSASKENGFTLLDELGRPSADPLLLLGVDVSPLVDRRLQPGCLGPGRAAMERITDPASASLSMSLRIVPSLTWNRFPSSTMLAVPFFAMYSLIFSSRRLIIFQFLPESAGEYYPLHVEKAS